MKANFDISLPSIPGKMIKFKIQDIKSASFGTQKSRFPDDKSTLVRKFVDSFQNFHQPIQKNDQTDTQAQSQLSKSFMTEKRQTKFRSMIPEHKKFLLPVYHNLKKKKQNHQNEQQPKKYQGGYTFHKQQATQFINQNKIINKQTEQGLTDNYYFSHEDPEKLQIEKQKKPRPSANFKNQTRKRIQQKFENSMMSLGPGAYFKDEKKINKKDKRAKSMKQNAKNTKMKGYDKNNNKEEEMDYNQLKQLIGKVIAQQPIEQEQIQQPKQVKNDHMFVLDDRDRFGEQIFPIAPRLKVPGPGTYQVNNNTLEEKSKKIMVIQQQRKLLKQWFNN